MEEKTQNCLRILGVLLLVLIFTMQAQASVQTSNAAEFANQTLDATFTEVQFPAKSQTDVTSALEIAEQDLREAVRNYENETQLRIAREDAENHQNMMPTWALIAANRGK